MDPIAKRFMWEVIYRLSTRPGKTAVILTTHSMNEAQALCTRTRIMTGFEAYVLDFQIRKNANSSPDDRKKRLQKSQISLTEERRKRNITLLVEEVMAELEFVIEEDAP
ncbi:hypothetical protein POM88_016564 [Heracleum sosnowskyi]|uniref:ATPase AAA-type core domain-containing protein n=1 Tax=Heracleum sosnowskyi TaxID=360622 RepID=A0AAD8IMU9_9APIA|nr:hypothetical protein POM88_016564 [Heracleum sosnowskyi]